MTDEQFRNLHEYIETEQSNICQIAAIRDGVLVYEDVWQRYSTDDCVNVMSVTKSITAMLIAIATDLKLIPSVLSPVLDFFPDYKLKRGEKTIQKVTIEQLLTMTAPYKYRSEPWTRVCSSQDWTVAALDLLGGKAGITGEFRYATLGVQILTGIIANASGMRTIDFANRFLFEPLGIIPRTDAYVDSREEQYDYLMSKRPKARVWLADPQGVSVAGWGLCLSAREMARIGKLCLQGGMYEGRQVVSEQSIRELCRPRVHCGESFDSMSYGYMWWITDEGAGCYAAIGDGGNVIYVNPRQNLTVAVTGTFKPRIFDRVQIIQKYIEPLVTGQQH